MPDSRSAKRVVAAGPGRLDGLLLGESGGQLAADHAVEQQVGGMPEDSWTDHADRDAADAQQNHGRGRAALRGQPFDQSDDGALEVAGAFRRRLHHAADRASQRPGHGRPPTPVPIAWESANSA